MSIFDTKMWKDDRRYDPLLIALVIRMKDGHRRCGKTNLNNPTVTDDVERPIK